MAITSEVDQLRQIPLFANVDRSYLQILVFSAERLSFKKGDALIQSGQRQDMGYLILRGRAVAYDTGSGKRIEVASIESGAFIGQMAMIARLPHAHDVVADRSIEALGISHSLFYRVCSEFPDTGAQVLNTLTQLLEGSMIDLAKIEELFRSAMSFEDLSGDQISKA